MTSSHRRSDLSMTSLEAIFHEERCREPFLEYTIYKVNSLGVVSTSQEELDRLKISIEDDILFPHTKDYIWTKEGMSLKVMMNDRPHENPTNISTPKNQEPSHPAIARLYGITRYGSNVEDEWFLISLLFEISRRYRDTLISVTDEDGDVLLIEVADELPSWLTPELSPNRVFIYQGHLHIIPLSREVHSIFSEPSISISSAFRLLTSHSQDTKASREIQERLESKLSDYPMRARNQLHHARVSVPADISKLLSHHPQLIAFATECFMTRDAIDMKACRKMARFPPTTMIETTIALNRFLYAQLVQQRFYPPKHFHLPSRSHPSFKASELGMKITCGFEILVMSSRYRRDCNLLAMKELSEDLDTFDWKSNFRWQTFKNHLLRHTYFKDQLEGSKMYSDLEKQAKYTFLTLLRDSDLSSTDTVNSRNPIHLIEDILRRPDDDVSLSNDEPEDDDGWMNVTPRDLEKLLADWQTGSDHDSIHRLANPAMYINRVTKKMNQFVHATSELEGVVAHTVNNKTSSDDEGNLSMSEEVSFDEISAISEEEFDPDRFFDDICEQEETQQESSIQINDRFTEESQLFSSTSLHSNESEIDESLNLLDNFMQSIASQHGEPGPVTTLLQSMGVSWPVEPEYSSSEDTSINHDSHSS